MADEVSLQSPGGWATALNMKVLGTILLGSLIAGGGAGVATRNYGTTNNAQSVVYIEAPLQQVTTKGGAFAALNPLPVDASGVIVSTDLFVANNPKIASRMDIGTSTGALGYSGSNVMNNVDVTGASRLLSWTATGSSSLTNNVVAPANSTGKRYITGSYGFGSGYVVGGTAGWVRIGIVNCSLQGQLHC